MPQAVDCITVEPVAPATGISPAFSRRAVFVGVAAATPLAVLPTVAALAEGSDEVQFWRAYAHWHALFNALPHGIDPGDDPVIMARYEEEEAALEAMLMIPVHTARAVLAKYVATDGEDNWLPPPLTGSWQVIGWDLERVAKREMFA